MLDAQFCSDARAWGIWWRHARLLRGESVLMMTSCPSGAPPCDLAPSVALLRVGGGDKESRQRSGPSVSQPLTALDAVHGGPFILHSTSCGLAWFWRDCFLNPWIDWTPKWLMLPTHGSRTMHISGVPWSQCQWILPTSVGGNNTAITCPPSLLSSPVGFGFLSPLRGKQQLTLGCLFFSLTYDENLKDMKFC